MVTRVNPRPPRTSRVRGGAMGMVGTTMGALAGVPPKVGGSHQFASILGGSLDTMDAVLDADERCRLRPVPLCLVVVVRRVFSV